MTVLDVVGSAAPACEVALERADAEPLAVLLESSAPHPIHPIALEWNAPLAWSGPWLAAWRDCGGLAVHAWHRLVFHRPLGLPLRRCTLAAEVVAQRQASAGALTVVRYRAADDDGPLWSTDAAVLWRGLTTVERGVAHAPNLARSIAPLHVLPVDVPADFAHRYSAASGIWNPVHTDPEAARAAGLPAPILHGSATLGLAVSAILARTNAGFPQQLCVQFLAPVVLPQKLEVVLDDTTPHQVAAEVRLNDGAVAARLRADFPTEDPRESS